MKCNKLPTNNAGDMFDVKKLFMASIAPRMPTSVVEQGSFGFKADRTFHILKTARRLNNFSYLL